MSPAAPAPAPVDKPPLHALCRACGWAMGGTDCFANDRCKCGHWRPPVDMRDPAPHHDEVTPS